MVIAKTRLEHSNENMRFMGEGRSHQEDAEISCCPGVGTAKADTFTLF
jgi:hypothetical protein